MVEAHFGVVHFGVRRGIRCHGVVIDGQLLPFADVAKAQGIPGGIPAVGHPSNPIIGRINADSLEA